MNPTLKRWLWFAAWGCLAASVFFVALHAAVGATPYQTRDSAGRAMGFNDPFSLEHYRIAFSRLRPVHLLSWQYLYDYIEWAMIAAGLVLLAPRRKASEVLCLSFFWAQLAIFPLGLLALPFFCGSVAALVGMRFDREGFVDVPFTLMMGQPLWALLSLVTALALHRARRARRLSATRQEPALAHA